MTTPEQARREQLAYGRSTLRASTDYPRSERSVTSRMQGGAPKPGPKGHEVILKAMQENGQIATIVTAAGGDSFVGTVTGRDKYTITLKTAHPDAERAARGETILRVFYKSAVEQFWGEQVPRRSETDETAVQ